MASVYFLSGPMDTNCDLPSLTICISAPSPSMRTAIRLGRWKVASSVLLISGPPIFWARSTLTAIDFAFL